MKFILFRTFVNIVKDLMASKNRFDKERCIKQINYIREWQKRQNSAIRWKKVMSEIYLLNACKLDREVNLFDFFLESIALRIKILINVTLSLIINNSCLFTSKLNTPIAVNIAIFLKTAFFIEHPWWLLLNSNLIVTTQILTKQKKVQKLNPFWRGGGGG